MDDVSNLSNSADNDVEHRNADVAIPKVNMKFDGHSWTHQANQSATYSETKTTSSEPVAGVSASSSQTQPPNPTATNEDTDREFDYTEDNVEYEEDDEETLEEEEAVDDGDDADELNDLAKESEMPLDDLLALYYNKPSNPAQYNSTEENQKSFPAENKNDDNDSDENEDLARQLRSSSSFLSPNHQQSGDEEDDRDYVPPAPDDWKKAPRVGDKYQAGDLPETNQQNPDYDANDDQLIWDPSVMAEDEVKMYLRSVGEAPYDPHVLPLPAGSHLRDNEDALYLLAQSSGDTAEASRRYRLRPTHFANELPVWTEEECRLFEHGLAVYGKDFHAIHQNRVKTKTIGEIVKFYYIWKKTARYDHFNAKTRLGKKKDTMHPGVTDYMERLLDETEHSLASHHASLNNAPSTSYPPPLNHTTALQQHLADIRMTRRRQHPQNNFESESPTIEYSDMNGLIDGEYPDDVDMLDGIVPTLPANHIYPPVPFAPISDAGLGYGDASHFAPIVSTNHHQELVHVNALPANQNNNSHVIANAEAANIPFQIVQPSEGKSNIGHVPNRSLASAVPLPPDVLSSIDQLETAYCGSSSSNASSSQSLTQSFPSDHSASVDSPSEREQHTLNLKRYHCPPNEEKKKREDEEGSSNNSFALHPVDASSDDAPSDNPPLSKNSPISIPLIRQSPIQSDLKDEDVASDSRAIVGC